MVAITPAKNLLEFTLQPVIGAGQMVKGLYIATTHWPVEGDPKDGIREMKEGYHRITTSPLTYVALSALGIKYFFTR